MAKNRGENIGEQYRNYRGMNTKAHNIEYLMYGIEDKYYKPQPGFREMVAIHGTPLYEKLLPEAEALACVKKKE